MRPSLPLLLFLLALAAFWTIVPSGCATIVPPTGGDRDSLPPVLIAATPGDSSVNFRGNRITFTFDELVEVKTQQSPVTISPAIDGFLEPRANGRTLTVRIGGGDTALEANTTYIINFGDAVVDVHEGNPLRNFSYVFSTGPVLDSLEISGRVQLAETGDVDSTLSVALYRDLSDSAVYLQRPQYVTKLDRNGNFRFGNLPGTQFNVFVFQNPLAPNRADSTNLFGFLNTPVRSGEADSLVLFAYRAAQPRTAGGPALGITPRTNIAAGDRRLRYNLSATGTQDLLSDFTVSFPVPLRSFDSTKIRLTTDSTAFRPAPFSARLDSTRKLLAISSPWQENTTYNLELQQDFATDTAGRQLLKTDTLFFTTKAAAEYGSLTLRFRNLDMSRKPVLLLVQNNEVVSALPFTSNVISRPRFLPGDYSLRLLYDTDGNGRWTPGNFRLRRQPELVRPIDRSISIKANWDNEIEIAL